MTITNPNLYAMRLLSAAGHHDYERQSAMMGQIRREDAETIYNVFAALYSHTSAAFDAIAPDGHPMRDQLLAGLADRAKRIATLDDAIDG